VAAGGEAATGWRVRVSVDRAFREAAEGAGGPAVAALPQQARPSAADPAAARSVDLTAARTIVGRRSRSQPTPPGIDLTDAPDDPGVSRSHAALEIAPDGTLSITDLGSSNGTWVGPRPGRLRRLAPGTATPLQDGDRVYLGSWTRITVHRR
jgi:pSer/pThr/pTyr-binding forkhead associated (FHA) protein